MSLYKKINSDAKEAMLKKDQLRSLVLKGVKASFINELLAKKPVREELTDDEVITVIRRLVNQRKDSIEQFTKGGRKDLAKNEEKELKILETYLPAMMSEKDVRKIVESKKKELGIEDKTKAGMLMSAIMEDLKGKADGADVKRIVEEILN